MNTMKKFFLRLLILCSFSTSVCGAQNILTLHDEVPEAEVIQDGRKFRIQLEKTVPITLTEEAPILGEISGLPSNRAISDSSIFLIDNTAKKIYKYNLHSGQYIATIGNRGQGPGEYINPTHIVVNPKDKNISIYDSNTLGNTYAQQGYHLHTAEVSRQMYRLLFDLAGNRFYLEKSAILKDSGWWSNIRPQQAMNIHKLNAAGKSMYHLILAPSDMTSLLEYANIYIGLDYSEISNRLYYMEPWSYKVKEIDAESGVLIRQFGIKPPSYISLPSTDQYKTAKFTVLEEFIIIDNKYLLLLFKKRNEGTGPIKLEDFMDYIMESRTCVAYDIGSEEAIHYFPVSPEDMYEWLKNANFLPTGTVAKDKFMYLYKPPLEEEIETSNGRIEVFSVRVE